MTVRHFLLFFEVAGVRKLAKTVSGNSMQQKVGSKSGLGGSWGRYWSHLGVILGSQIGSEEGPKTTWFLSRFLRGPREGLVVLRKAPPCSRGTAGKG